MSKNNISMRSNSDEPEELDKIIRGSYDDFVRLERRNLLATSAITLIFFFGKVTPKNLPVAGFDFPNVDARMLFVILFFACLYFLTAYMIYAYPGFRDARNKWRILKSQAMQITGNRHRLPIEGKNFLSSARYTLWLLFNYALPVVAGVSALAIGVCKVA